MQLTLDEELRKYNFDLFEERYGFRPQISDAEEKKYDACRSLNNETVIYIKGEQDGSKLRLNSLYDPGYEAERWADRFDFINRKTTILLWGLSNGVYFDALKRKLRPDTDFFIIEPSEDFFSFICGFVNLRAVILDENVHLFINDEQKRTLSAKVIDYVISFRSEAYGIVTPFYLASEEFTHLCSEVEKVAFETAKYQRERARDAIKNRLYSWNHMTDGFYIQDLAEMIPENIPAIIVSAGPSLRKNVNRLKDVKGHAFILCTDRAVVFLEKYDITPDAIISVDAQKSPDFITAAMSEAVPLICSHQVNKELQKMFPGKCIYYHQLEYEKNILGNTSIKVNGLDQGGNVAGGAFVVCKLLGISTIVLMGQDLAYSEGKHHVDDRSDGIPQGKQIEIEGINGERVISNEMWISFKEFFEREIISGPSLKVIDATEGGAIINGTTIMGMDEVVDICKDLHFDFSAIFQKLPFAQTKQEHEQTVSREKEWVKDIDEIADISKEIVQLSTKLLDMWNDQAPIGENFYDQLSIMNQKRSSIVNKSVYKAMEEFWIQDIYSIPDSTFTIRSKEEGIDFFENIRQFYTDLIVDCNKFREVILDAIEE